MTDSNKSDSTARDNENNRGSRKAMSQQIRVLNVRLPDEVIKWIDSLVKSGVYNSRSEAIREFIRLEMSEGQEEAK